MRYRMALANSLNISAVKVLASIGGPAPLQELLQQCGLSTLERPAEHYGLGLTIGNAEARLLELANAYACLARLGQYKPYRLARDLANARGSSGQARNSHTCVAADVSRRHLGSTQNAPTDVGGYTLSVNGAECARCGLRFHSPTGRQVADPAAAHLIADILSDNDARASTFGAESPLRFDFPVACKTGTSSDFRDNWAFGFTPEFTVGVWVGNFDGAPMERVSGVTGAAPLLHELIEHLHQHYGTTWYATPTNIVECWIHPVTGKRLLSEARIQPGPDAIREKFLASNLPPLETPADYASLPSNVSTEPSDFGLRTSHFRLRRIVRLGGEYRDWLASSDNWLGSRAVLAPAQPSLRILFPPPSTVVYLDPDLPHHGRRLSLRAAGPEDLDWQSESLQITREGSRQVALLTEGRHQITVRDPLTGAQADTWLEVVAR